MDWQTTFWQDFTIADVFGVDAVKDTCKRAFGEWRSDVVYVTELTIVLNWKCWEHYEKGAMQLSELYHDLCYVVWVWCLDNLKGADLEYYFRMTD